MASGAGANAPDLRYARSRQGVFTSRLTKVDDPPRTVLDRSAIHFSQGLGSGACFTAAAIRAGFAVPEAARHGEGRAPLFDTTEEDRDPATSVLLIDDSALVIELFSETLRSRLGCSVAIAKG